MRVGVPRGLLFCQYSSFYLNFFINLGVDVVTSEETNKEILNDGIKYCVDEACLPVKIFHGHCASLIGKCDYLFIPRIMKVHKDEYICPKFCGIGEMITNDIPDLPQVIQDPIYADTKKHLKVWCYRVGKKFTKNLSTIENAYKTALYKQENFQLGMNQENFSIKIALLGHPYNVYDNYANMNLMRKLNKLGIGIITEEFADIKEINNEMSSLYKKPFWTFERKMYGFALNMYKDSSVDGFIYISSFACGIDSIVIELIKNQVKDFPFLELKIDEQTGEVGFDTRLEAFTDMLYRKKNIVEKVNAI
ncbi:acyl-CoA dehydratase activase-related protein [Clostridium sp. JN-9]|uniref:acyl-CoA dehydratase activase-related protein n=1 Tax=Clostridium sp. JN-9 TaxID=2507159 RepID=UPI000FFE2D58|nr:acyl-CoA dehydratase activase-related protein [Clostridium sp. JN-9]QAT40365.1 2-hydroxyglutaryl-CoA dehydratase [Clostridium sp. JN-9]